MAAERAAEYAERAGGAEARQADPRDWVIEAHTRVRHVMAVARRDVDEAIEILRENARATAEAVYLPPPTV